MRCALVILLIAANARAQAPSQDRIRAAAAKAVVLIQNSQKNWFMNTNCASCHHQDLPAMAFALARGHGIPVNDDFAATARTFASFLDLDRAIDYTHVIDPALDDGYRLLAAQAAGVPPSLTTALYARHLAVRQKPDGHWVTGDIRPPQGYGDITATAVVLWAIQLYHHPSLDADTRERAARARAWLAAQTARNTEERIYQLVGLRVAGADQADISKFADNLKATQQPDGGWNSLDSLASESYSTGEALVTLHGFVGIPTTDPAYLRGVQFLLNTQAADGSWHVHSRLHPPPDSGPPYFETGFPYEHDQFISAAGTSWAIMALADMLPVPQEDETSGILRGLEPKDVPAWAETVLFGTAKEVEALLKKGKLTPNSATKTGTTALMMAVPDLEKTKLLLSRGAKINARSKNRYNALLVASIYPNSTPLLKFLLDKGAEVRAPAGQEPPYLNATALGRAAQAGNFEAIPWFRAKGDKFTDLMNYVGLFPGPMVFDPFNFGDVRTATALLDAGMNIEFPDGAGTTLLDNAVVANRVEIAKLLISRGAKVNARDKLGMTPLLYATRADFGDSQMIDLLLKNGADPAIANEDGETPLNLAQKYGHSHLIPSLAKER